VTYPPPVFKNFHGHTLDHLGEAIVAGRYNAKTSLPSELVLCAELGVSRPVLREALKSLIAKGMLTTGPKVGIRVLEPLHWNWFDPDVIAWQSRVGLTPEFLRDLQDLRRVVEPAAIRLAAERISPRDIAEIEAAYNGMERAVKGGGDYVTYDLLFHQGLLRASGNRMLVQMSKALGALLRTSFEFSTRRPDGPAKSLPLHRAILDAVVAHQPDVAEAAVRALIDLAKDDIEKVLLARRRLPRLNTPARPLRASSGDANTTRTR
jgi:DNA-binding FadR family transcriptional regulator